jgi:RNA polymerase sigma-70 factor, ECF subfamily
MSREVNAEPFVPGTPLDEWRRSAGSYLARCGVDRASRADLMQEILMRLHGLAGAAPVPRVLVFTVAANATRSFFRKVAVQRRVFADAADLERMAYEPSGEEAVEANELALTLDRAIAELPLLQREVVVLCGLECLEQADVARVLGIPVGSVKTNLRRARLALAKVLARRKRIEEREVAS